MFTDHPFLAVSDFLPPRFMQVYVVLMAIAVVVGTLADVYHKRSGEFFAADRQRKRAAAKRPLGGGELVSMFYVTSAPLLERALELIAMLKEDLDHVGADSLHQLMRAWELSHRVWTAESVVRHTLFREETRWSGYYYRADHPRLVDDDWHVFTSSRYDAKSRAWQMEKLPVHHIVS